MLSLKIGFADTIKNPHCEAAMLGCGLIVVAEKAGRKRFGDASVMGPSKHTQIRRRDGIAVIYGSETGAINALTDRDGVPDPVVIVVIAKSSKRVDAAAKKRGATVVVIAKGFAATAEAVNKRGGGSVTVTPLSDSPKKSNSSPPPADPKADPTATGAPGTETDTD